MSLRLFHYQTASVWRTWSAAAIATTTTTTTTTTRAVVPQSTSSRRSLNVASRPSDLVGRTPLLDLSSLLSESATANDTKLFGKLESLGPCSSVKDRIGKSMIDDAEAKGLIKPGYSVLVEPTSGNTGIAIAFIARERGYRCILTMPETMSIERRMMLLALDCEVVLTPKETAVPGALAKAKEICAELGDQAFMLQQFENPANPKAHYETTGPEMWEDTDGMMDILISGVGTGGTLTGCSRFLKDPTRKPTLKTVAVEPREQMLITEAKGGEKLEPVGPHKIQGMGAGLVPQILDLEMIDAIRPIHSEEAMDMAHQLWMKGIPVGASSGAIVAAAVQEMNEEENAGKMGVAIVPSFGERYFTHPMFGSIKEKAESLVKQPLPEPFDNTQYGFPTARG